MNIPQQDPSFIWPGEAGFTNFPKHLPEDCTEYFLHVVDSKIKSDLEIRAKLQDIQKTAKSFNKTHLKDYIWQRERFELNLERKDGRSFLRGKTEFGDSIGDEWLIVFLLRELSAKFPQVWIQITDADGEFLLVEAANALPKWLNPEVADNRVWINKHQLRIIPRSLDPANPKNILRNVSLSTALDFIEKHSQQLIQSPLIESEAFFRLRNYPAQISESFHTAQVTIPRNLAYILNHKPEHISPAIEAFYLRDPISLRPLRANETANLVFPPQDLVTTSIKFTRVGYAQLQSQEFPIPAAWEKVDLPPENPAAALGMKLSCGFEMLVADSQNKSKLCVREINILLADIVSGDDELPTDEELASRLRPNDDDSWMDVNYADFEAELQGKKRGGTKVNEDAFGDKTAHENLTRMVERFEQFLNDDDAGIDGVDEDGDEMDEDDDEDEDEDEDDDDDGHSVETIDEAEDRDASFDEEEFESAMREMMGLPKVDKPEPTTRTSRIIDSLGPDLKSTKDTPYSLQQQSTNQQENKNPSKTSNHRNDPPIPINNNASSKPQKSSNVTPKRPFEYLRSTTPAVNKTFNPPPKYDAEENSKEETHDTNSTSDEDISLEEMEEIMAQMEAELRAAGALNLDPTGQKTIQAPRQAKSKSKPKSHKTSNGKGKGKGRNIASDNFIDENDDDNDDEEDESDPMTDVNDPRFNLAKNILESFKSQGGSAGPAGNLMRAWGLGMMERDGAGELSDDEDDDDDAENNVL